MTTRELFSFPNPVDEHAARTVAAGVAVLAGLALATGWTWLVVLLAVGGLGVAVLVASLVLGEVGPADADGPFSVPALAAGLGGIGFGGAAATALLPPLPGVVTVLAGPAAVAVSAAPARAGAVGAAAGDPASPRLVVVGAPGLAWSDLDGGDLPALDALANEGALGSLTVRAVRSRACAVDGWLTLSSGRRAADVAGHARHG